MELDELKAAWIDYGRQMERQAAQRDALQRARGLHGIGRRVRLLAGAQLLQLAIGLLFSLWGGAAWTEHWGTWHLVAYGLALHGYGLALLATAAVQLRRIGAIDYAGPIADSQQAIVRARRARLRSDRVLFACGGVMWVPALGLLLYAAGVDLWALRPAVVLANLLAGLAVSVVLVAASLRWPAWFERSAQHRRLAEIERDLCDLHEARSDGGRPGPAA
ncbi:hypothetical protein [Xanthomonas sp. CFBP 8445]|uniref:hypothetical protein n=1 Tax=Xanthomonas sp. CFBP 8445 TaxID=2971236 RepID=UPI0021E0BF0A|nr:hypothetical protein [Xanthomonas sp. CFBP 8445]UYC10716.1 hypothetical protein NUG21_13075 [Xanthomonas sp. CFBP 8445]